jgi:hypothetical protein
MTHLQETFRQFTLENCRITSALQQSVALKTSHVCNGDTVLQEANLRNGKSMPGCAQTVEDGTSLWKPPEKTETISWQLPRYRRRKDRQNRRLVLKGRGF